MNVEVEAGGRRRVVTVVRRGGDWLVTLDDRVIPVSVTEIGGRWSLLIGRDGGAGERGVARQSHEVAFAGDAASGLVAFVDGVAVPLQVPDPRLRNRRVSGDGAEARGPRAIAAPMPGRVVKVLVEQGQAVAARQPVVIVEAMKMENELRAPRAGTVAAVHVSEGMSVDAHTVLVVLE